MHDIRTLIVGTGLTPDGSTLTTGSKAAILEARWFAEQVGARILLAHSSDKDVYYDPLNRNYAVVSEGTSPEGVATLEGAVEELRGADLETELVLGTDRPWLDVTRLAMKTDDAVVVVGRHDDPDEEVHKLGSVSTKLMRKCPKPVWVVRPGLKPEPERILAATDLTPVGDVVTQYAAFLTQKAHAELHVVHFYQIPMSLQLEMGRLSDEHASARIKELHQSAVDSIRGELDRAGVADGAHIHVACGAPGHGTMDLVEKLAPELVVMGTVSRGVAGILMGSTAEHLVGRIHCSLLTVKPDDFVSPIQP